MNDPTMHVLTSWIRVEKRKRVPATTGIGFTHVHDGFERVTYEVTINRRDLESMAQKAAHNKSGHGVDGALVVEVLKREPCE